MSRQDLLQQLNTELTTNSLRLLCFDLNVDYDNLVGDNKKTRLLDLINHLDNRGRLAELEAIAASGRLPQADDGQQPLRFPFNNLPRPNPHFSGRTRLLADLQAAEQQTVAITQAIAGLGGVGKTQLALAYAHQQRQRFDLIWWLNGSEIALIDSGLRQLGQMLRLPLPTESQAARQMVLSWLGSSDKRWLLIYDNVDTLTAQALYPLLPSGGAGCQLLLTSRNPHWHSLGQVVDLNVFTPAEAHTFLRERLGELADADELAETLGFLPLALEQAAAYIHTRRSDVATYLRLFATRRQALWASSEPPNAYHGTVATTWLIGFEQVAAAPAAVSGAADLLTLCSFLAADDIPLSLLLAAFAEVDGLRESPLRDELARGEALLGLRHYALLAGDEASLTMHRLVQMVYQDQLEPAVRNAWLDNVATLMQWAWPFDPNEMASWEASRRLLLHLLAVVDAANTASSETESVATLNSHVGFYFDYFGDLAAALPFSRRALAIREKVLGGEHPDTAQSLNNLGHLLQAMGELAAARPYYQRALVIYEKVLGGEHPATAQSLNNLGHLLQAMRQLVAAWPYYERALTIQEKVLGGEHPATARSLNNLGALLQEMGKLAAARPYYERALAIHEKVLGDEHPDTARSLNNLGALLQEMGKLAAARPYYERALAIYEKVLGGEHPATALSLNNLGGLLQAMGELAAARPYFERALAIREKVLGTEHPDTASILNNLAVLAYYEQDLAEAARLMRRALRIREQRLGANNSHTQNSRQDLAVIESQLP